MKSSKILLTTLVIFCMSGYLYAQNPVKGKSGFGPRIGYYKAPDADDGTMFIGLQTRARGEIFGFELAAEYRGEQDYTVTGGNITVSQIPVTGSLMLFVPLAPNFQPYGLAGLGAYYSIYDYDGGFVNPGDDSEVNLGYHLGFGLDMPLSSSAALNVDYRYLFLDGNEDRISEKEFSGNVITAGLTFYF